MTSHPLDRRSLLWGTAAAASATVGGAAVGGAAATPSLPDFHLLTPPDMDFQALFALGEAAYGAGEAGEVLAAIETIRQAGISYQVFYDTFMRSAARVGRIAADALAAGYKASARAAFLRSAQYYNQALFFVLGTATPDAEESVYRQMQAQWHAAATLFEPAFEAVRIPYAGSDMPGYFLSGGGGRRPTAILSNGSDGQNIDLFAFGGMAAIERGWNALIFEGPGQGAMLFERKIPFRPDWEAVITPIVDVLAARPDVDARRIALIGWSLGGELVTRAAAFERRLAAVVADPGLVDNWSAYPASVRGIFAGGASAEQVNHIWQTDVIPTLNPVERFTLAKRAEIFAPQFLDAARAGKVFTDLWTFGRTVMRFSVADVAAQVTAPTLVVQYERDQFFPRGAEQLMALLTCPKTMVTFTAAEGAAQHCAPLAPQRRNQVVFDWLDATLKTRL
jgi:dienelactone hydrolase